MPDLIDKFFQEDLTEAEQQALSDTLLNSDETALKFEARAREIYLAFGFSEPQADWPENGNPPWHSSPTDVFSHGSSRLYRLSHLGHWIWPSVFLAAGIVAAVAWHFAQKASMAPPPPALAVEKLRVQTLEDTKPPVSASTRAPQPTSTPQRANSPTPLAISAGITPIGPSPRVTPLSAGVSNSPTFSTLSVVVSQSKADFVTVRVLEPQGKVVVVLYKGNLEPGDWAFQWDGKSSDGYPAQAGYYQIEVQTGSFIQHKNVQIQ